MSGFKISTMNQNPIDFKRLFLFLIVAIPLSNIFRFDVFGLSTSLQRLPIWLYLLITVLLEGSGVFIGAMIGRYLLKKQCKVEISLFGTSVQKGLLMSLVPIVLLSIIGVKNSHGLSPHLYGLIAGIGSWIYCILEEYGWRGYLQEEFKDQKPPVRYLLIGFIWYFWHLIFLENTSPYDNLFILAMMIFGSWGIGKIVELTKSIMASACFHLIIQIMMFGSFIKNGIDLTQKLIIFGISVSLWVIILRQWDKQKKLEIR